MNQDPSDTESLQLLGLIHADTGRVDTAIQLLRAAIGIEGPKAWLCRNLGIVFERSGDLTAAAACYRQALVETPSDHDLWGALAKALSSLERHREAVSAWNSALESESCDAGTAFQYRLPLANTLTLLGEYSAAIEQYGQILKQDPAHVEATFNRAVVLMQDSQSHQAIAGFQRTLELDPRHARAANNLGILYQLNRDVTMAIRYYKLAAAADHSFPPSIYNLGTAWLESGSVQNAVAVFRKVLKIQPDHIGAWTNLGNARLAENATGEAIRCYRTALSIAPADAAAEWNLGIVSLLTGDLENGWKGYERRFEVKGSPARRAFTAPLWRGEALAGKRLLLHAEQGLGDTLQFIRYAPLLQARGAQLVIECQSSLLPLLLEFHPGAEWIPAPKREPGATTAAPVDHLPPVDYQLPMMSAPVHTGGTRESIPSPGGYLRAPAGARERWKKWLGARGWRPRVGLCWAGNPSHKNDRNRSIPHELLSELEAAGVEWINLQVGRPIAPALDMRNAARELRNFSDTAGLIENLDLVVSVDSSVAHLTGALGKPVWVLLPFAPDWRWLLGRSDSPWYSSAKLFRQPEAGRWRPVLQRVARELADGGILKT